MRFSVPSLLVFTLASLAGCNDVPTGAAIAIEPAGPTTIDDLTAVVVTPAIDKHEVTYSYAWAVDGQAQADLTTDTVPAAQTARGQEWSVVVTPNDGKVDGDTASAAVTIANTAPSATVSLQPASPTTLDELVASSTQDDIDGDAITLNWSWTQDGSAVTGQTTDKIPDSLTAKGQVWQVRVVPTDGQSEGLEQTASVTIGNEAPVAVDVVIGPADIYTDSTISATVDGSDPDGDDVLSWTYTWYVAGGAIPGGGATLDGANFSKGDEVFVEAVANDGSTDSNVVTSSSITVLNTPPSLATATIDPGVINRLSTLSCVPAGGLDIDGDSITYTTTWSVAGREIGAYETIGGEFFSKGDAIICTLTPNDGEQDGTPVSSGSVNVDNTPPTMTGVSLSPLGATTTDELTATGAGMADIDGDDVTVSYSWTVGGVSAGTGATLAFSSFKKGDVVIVTATPNDGEDDGTSVTASITIANTAPTDPGVEIDPAVPADKDDLLCDVVSPSTDIDGDRLTYTITWSLDGTAWTGSVSTTLLTGDTIDAGDTGLGDEWTCSVVASDGTDSSSTITSAAVTVTDRVDYTLFVTSAFLDATTTNHLSNRAAGDAKCATEATAASLRGKDWKIVYSTSTEDAKDYVDYDKSRGDRVYDRTGKQIDAGDLWGTSTISLPNLKTWTITGTSKSGEHQTCSGPYAVGSWPICQSCSKQFACAGSGTDPFNPTSCCWSGTRAIVCVGEKL